VGSCVLIAEDFFAQFDRNNPLTRDAPLGYRRLVLESGGSMSANDLRRSTSQRIKQIPLRPLSSQADSSALPCLITSYLVLRIFFHDPFGGLIYVLAGRFRGRMCEPNMGSKGNHHLPNVTGIWAKLRRAKGAFVVEKELDLKCGSLEPQGSMLSPAGNVHRPGEPSTEPASLRHTCTDVSACP